MKVPKYLQVALDSSLKRLRVRTNNLSTLLAVLEKDECRHGADSEFLCNVGDLVDVELEETGVGVGVGHPVEGEVLLAIFLTWHGWMRSQREYGVAPDNVCVCCVYERQWIRTLQPEEQ